MTLDSSSGKPSWEGIGMLIHTIHLEIFTCGLIHFSRRDNSLRLEHRHPSPTDQNFLIIILQEEIFNTSSIHQHIRTFDIAPTSSANNHLLIRRESLETRLQHHGTNISPFSKVNFWTQRRDLELCFAGPAYDHRFNHTRPQTRNSWTSM